MTVEHIRRDDDHGAGLDRLACEFVGADGRAAHRSDRRIEPVGLVDHRASYNKAISETVESAAKLAVCLGLDTFPPFARLRQQIQSPSDAVGSRFLAGSDEG
jgi:hypothetical protein